MLAVEVMKMAKAFKQLVLLLVAMKFIKLSEFVKDWWVRYSGADMISLICGHENFKMAASNQPLKTSIGNGCTLLSLSLWTMVVCGMVWCGIV